MHPAGNRLANTDRPSSNALVVFKRLLGNETPTGTTSKRGPLPPSPENRPPGPISHFSSLSPLLCASLTVTEFSVLVC